MYSTHTSSSYSPSISDGTMTPNSHHLIGAPTAAGQEDHPTEGKINGGADGEDLPKPKRLPHFHHHHHHHYHHQQALKIANKLRKINKEAKMGATAGGGATGAATKFDKLTGEGIKSRGDGSYQCQFCEKTFPRLGYLKHHVQVSYQIEWVQSSKELQSRKGEWVGGLHHKWVALKVRNYHPDIFLRRLFYFRARCFLLIDICPFGDSLLNT